MDRSQALLCIETMDILGVILRELGGMGEGVTNGVLECALRQDK